MKSINLYFIFLFLLILSSCTQEKLNEIDNFQSTILQQNTTLTNQLQAKLTFPDKYLQKNLSITIYDNNNLIKQEKILVKNENIISFTPLTSGTRTINFMFYDQQWFKTSNEILIEEISFTNTNNISYMHLKPHNFTAQQFQINSNLDLTSIQFYGTIKENKAKQGSIIITIYSNINNSIGNMIFSQAIQTNKLYQETQWINLDAITILSKGKYWFSLSTPDDNLIITSAVSNNYNNSNNTLTKNILESNTWINSNSEVLFKINGIAYQ